MSAIYLPAILGPEMATQILWVGAWDFLVLSAGKPPCSEILVLGGGG